MEVLSRVERREEIGPPLEALRSFAAWKDRADLVSPGPFSAQC
jgi:hypothetical protein